MEVKDWARMRDQSRCRVRVQRAGEDAEELLEKSVSAVVCVAHHVLCLGLCVTALGVASRALPSPLLSPSHQALLRMKRVGNWREGERGGCWCIEGPVGW